MGYSYGRTDSGRYALACDGCGDVGGVRKRPCKYRVRYGNGTSLPYCPAPALCASCFARHGGTAGIHGERCREGAAASQAEQDTLTARLAAGDAVVSSAFGDWHGSVPEGHTGVSFRDGAGNYVGVLMPRGMYDHRTKRFRSDYPADLPAWTG